MTVSAYYALLISFLLLVGLAGARPGLTAGVAPPPPPSESLAGLVPGVSRVSDAVNQFGAYDIILPGFAEFFVGGGRATKSYEWSIGLTLGQRILTVEATIGEEVINLVIADQHPGLATSRGLRPLLPEHAAWELYGMPDFAFEWTFFQPSILELFYLDEGLILIMKQVPGRLNWTITRIILTYPSYLGNAVVLRVRESLATHNVRDITYSYRVWSQMAVPAR